MAEQASGALTRELREIFASAERAKTEAMGARGVEELVGRTLKLASSARLGLGLAEPPCVAVLGRPNAGKSSLFNALLGVDRTIVTPHAGTTRDSVEAVAGFEGLAVTLVDTAGLAEFADEVDRAAVERTWETVARSRAALYLFEAGREIDPADRALAERVRSTTATIFVRTKCDLAGAEPRPGEIAASAVTGAGLREVEGAILDALFGEWRRADSGPLVFTREQAERLAAAAGRFRRAGEQAALGDREGAALGLERGGAEIGAILAAGAISRGTT